MNVLLRPMPDSFEHMSPVTVRMPTSALSSLAGNVDQEHQVAVPDLILVQNRVREAVEELVQSTAPAVVGLSVMTFQRRTAGRSSMLARGTACSSCSSARVSRWRSARFPAPRRPCTRASRPTAHGSASSRATP